jgi:hypothetical protein
VGRRSLVPLALAGALLAGCGADAEEFQKRFGPINRELVALVEDVGASIQGASGKSDQQIEREFGRHAQRMGTLREDVEGLDAPGDVQDEQEALTRAMAKTQEALGDIEKAADKRNVGAARSATIELVTSSEELRKGRQAVAREAAAAAR